MFQLRIPVSVQTLYGKADNFRTQKVTAAAAFGNVKLALKEADPPADKFPLHVVSSSYTSRCRKGEKGSTRKELTSKLGE